MQHQFLVAHSIITSYLVIPGCDLGTWVTLRQGKVVDVVKFDYYITRRLIKILALLPFDFFDVPGVCFPQKHNWLYGV